MSPLRFSLFAAIVTLSLPRCMQAAETRDFDIPAGEAIETLRNAARRGGVQVMFVASAVHGVKTREVKGNLTTQQVLERMLSGTGLVVVWDAKTETFSVSKPAPTERSHPPRVEEKRKQSAAPRPLNGLVRLLTGAIAAWTTPFAAAQDAPSPGTPPQETTVQLSPFEVTTSRDVGYLATNTLAGSRFNTSLKDTPATISVMTSEFLSDIGATQMEEALQYAVNIEFFQDDDRETINGNATFQSYQAYRTRGLSASQSRNFFNMSGPGAPAPTEMAFVDRIEDSRGPNSVMSGIAQPGGTINTGTKQAITGRAFDKGSVMYGSYDSKRATLDLNRPFGQKLAVRLNLVYNDNNTFRHYEHQTHLRGLIAASYRFSNRTRIRAEFERGQLESNKAVGDTLRDQSLAWMTTGRPTTETQTAIANTTRINQNNRRVTYIGNDDSVIDMRGTLASSGTNNTITDSRIADYSVNWGGLGQNRFSRFGIFSAFFEHQVGRNTFLELGFNHSDQSFDNRHARVDSQQLRGDPNQRLNGANQVLNGGGPNPFAGRLYIESNWFRTTNWEQSDTGRAQLSHQINLNRWGSYHLAGVAEYEKRTFLLRTFREVWYDATTGQLGPFNAVPDNAQNNVYRRTYVTEGRWESYALTGPIGSGGLLENVRDAVSGRTLSSTWMRQTAPEERYFTQKSGMFVAQARYFKNRLILMSGLRRDEYDEFGLATQRNGATQIWEVNRDPRAAGTSSNHVIARTKTFGVVYHVTPRISLVSNLATNASLPARGQRVRHPSGEPGRSSIPAPKPIGRGRDYGIGINLIENKLYFKATHYQTQARDQSTTSPGVGPAHRAILDLLLGNGLISQEEHDRREEGGASNGLFGQESKGYEVELTGNLTENWRLTAAFSRSKAVDTYRFNEWLRWEELFTQSLQPFRNHPDIGAEIDERLGEIRDVLQAQTSAVGVGKLGNRANKFSTTTRYNIRRGWLRNSYVGGSYRHQSKMFVGRNLATGEKLYGNSFGYADLLLGYAIPGLKKRRLSFQLNVFNVLDKQKPLVIRYTGADPSVVFRNVVQPPRTFRLTTNFEF